MSSQMLAIPGVFPAGEVVALNIPAEVYLSQYASERCEWVKGVVIQMPPASLVHQEIVLYIVMLLKAYFSLKPSGRVIGDAFMMKLDDSYRLPDAQVILNENIAAITETYLDGAADICLEVVSESSVSRDYGDKFAEYEAAGVREYWIIDPIRQEAHFYQRGENGLYKSASLDEGNYLSPLLPGFKLHVATLWQTELPSIFEITALVQAMLKDKG